MQTDEERAAGGPARRPGKGWVWALGLTAGVAAVFSAWWHTGSLEAMGRFATGDRLFLTRSVLDLGRIAPKAKVKARFTARNLSGGEVNIVGTQVSCSCTLLGDPTPVPIPGGGSRPLQVVVTAPGKPGEFQYSLDLFTDSPDRPRMNLFVKGVVMSP